MLRHDRQIRGRCVRKFSAGCKREDPSNSESLTTLISILSDNFPILHSGIATCDRAFAGISVARPAVTGIRYTRCLHLRYIPPHFPLPGNRTRDLRSHRSHHLAPFPNHPRLCAPHALMSPWEPRTSFSIPRVVYAGYKRE